MPRGWRAIKLLTAANGVFYAFLAVAGLIAGGLWGWLLAILGFAFAGIDAWIVFDRQER